MKKQFQQKLVIGTLFVWIITVISQNGLASQLPCPNADLFPAPGVTGGRIEVTELGNGIFRERSAGIHIPFIANEGQIADQNVLFYATTFSGHVVVTREGDIVYSLPRFEQDTNERGITRGGRRRTAGVCVLRERLFHGENSMPAGQSKSSAVVHFFIGNDRARWRTNVTAWERVSLGEIVEGIQLSLKAYQHNIEKIFYVRPGADPSEMTIVMEGAESLGVNESGELVVGTELGNVRFSKPEAFQEEAAGRRYIEVAYRVNGNAYGFEVGNYDASMPLVIDPMLASTFIGGDSDDYGSDIAVDSSGYVYITGFTTAEFTSSTNTYPTTSGAYDVGYNGDYDIVVSKIDTNLRSLVASTFIGGNSNDYSYAIALDGSGNVYVTGSSTSTNYPVSADAYDTGKNGIESDVVISKLDSTLSTLLASTYVGGSGEDEGFDMAVDSAGNVLVTGSGGSGYPTTAGAYSNGAGVVVSKLDCNLTNLLASTSIGGGSGRAIALDDADHVYVTGYTYDGVDYPTTTNAYDRTHNGSYETVVSVLDSDLANLLASTYLGGYGWDSGYGIALDSSTNVYVTGYTWAGSSSTSDFPVTANAYDTTANGGNDVFVSKFDTSLSNLLNSTFIGGSESDKGLDIILDTAGNVYVTGITDSTNYPATSNAYDTSFNGETDILVSRLDGNLENLTASTFLGGTNSDGNTYGNILAAIALDSSGNVLLTGMTESGNFPATTGAYDTQYTGGKVDVYISKLDESLSAGTTGRQAVPCDYDGDGKTDPAVYHEASGFWFMILSGSWMLSYEKLGEPGYSPVTGDFDGDGKADLAVYHEASGWWYYVLSDSWSLTYQKLGETGYTPVSGDYDGDGKTDLAVYHESTGWWYFILSDTGSFSYEKLGETGYTPISGDYDGDGKTDLAVYHEASGWWYYVLSDSWSLTYQKLGETGYTPVSGDYDGDGKTDLAVYHESTGWWYFILSDTGSFSYEKLGETGYTPVSGDYDGDGKTDLTVYHETSGWWYCILSSSGSLSYYQLGGQGYQPVGEGR